MVLIYHNSKTFSDLQDINISVSNDRTGSFRGIGCNLFKARSRSHNHSLSFNHVNGTFVTMMPLFQAVQVIVELKTQLTNALGRSDCFCSQHIL